MNTYKSLTYRAVREAALFQMLLHGETTTLEVKNHLRSTGYWALQRDVSRMMRRLAREEHWAAEDGRRFRIYSLQPDVAACCRLFRLHFN